MASLPSTVRLQIMVKTFRLKYIPIFKMKKKYPIIYPLFFSFALILQLIFLYYIKYLNQGLTLNEFSLNNIGNIFNLLIILCLIIGIGFYFRRKHAEITSLIILIFISTLTLFIAYLLTKVELPLL